MQSIATDYCKDCGSELNLFGSRKTFLQIWRKKTIKISLKILNKPVDNKKKTLNILHKTPLIMFYNCANILTTQQGLPYKSLQSTLYFTVLCDLCKHMLYFIVLCDLCKHKLYFNVLCDLCKQMLYSVIRWR